MADGKGIGSALGRLGSFFIGVLAFLGTNWQIVVSAGLALGAGLWSGAFSVATNQHFQIIVITFFLLFFSYVAVRILQSLAAPRQTQTYQDYRYGLTFEGVAPNFNGANSPMPDPGSLQLSIQLRNYSPGPIEYTLETLAIQIGTRAIPKYKANTVKGYMARGSARTSQGDGFPSGSLSEFYGKGPVKGTVDFSITYGPPDAPPIRRLRLSLDATFVFPEGGIVDVQRGIVIGFGSSIATEDDEPISTL